MNDKHGIRVLVALDCAHPEAEILRRLPELIGAGRIELHGLYIEDEDLARATRIPGLREISLAGQQIELTSDRMARETAEELARIRRAFEDLAQDLRLECRVEVGQGRVAEVLCKAASESDFVIVSRSSRAAGLRPRHGGQFGPLLKQTRRILFVNEPWSSGSSVVVLGHNSQALAAAARLALAESLRLIVALPTTAPAPEILPEIARLIRLIDWNEAAIADLCLGQDARLLVVSEHEQLDTAELLTRLMDRLPCSVLKFG